jgi:hypothetical protein
MADSNPTLKFDYANLTTLSGRLSRRADDIVMIGAQEIADDLRVAGRMASKFAAFRFRVGEIADAAVVNPEWDRATFARDLRDALADAENGHDPR